MQLFGCLRHRSTLSSRIYRACYSSSDPVITPPRRWLAGARVRSRVSINKVAAQLRFVRNAGLEWTLAGGISSAARPTAAPPSDSTAQCRSACRFSPFASKAYDKRGRLEDLFECIVEGRELSRVASQDDSHFDYIDGVSAGTTSVPLVASRLSLPGVGALVPVEDWLHPSTALKFRSPQLADSSAVDVAPNSYFRVSPHQWRATVRRLVRSQCAIQISANDFSDVSKERGRRAAAGAFSVRKDAEKDRLIGDRRLHNAMEQAIGQTLLPYAPRSRRLHIPRSHKICGATRDVKNFYFMLRTDAERSKHQIVGPRIPRSWSADLEDESLDYGSDFESWYAPDLRDSELCEVDEGFFCQIAFGCVLQGAHNAVTAALQAHRRILLSSGGLSLDEMILPGAPFPRSACIGDVYIDDLVCFSCFRVFTVFLQATGPIV